MSTKIIKGSAKVQDTMAESLATAEQDFISKLFNFISRWSIYLLVFLMPLFFLPQIVDSIYLSKQFLAAVLILLSVIALVARILFKGDAVSFIKTKLTWLLLLFVAVVASSSIFSGAKYLSFWGFGGSEPFTGLSVALIVLFYFLARVLFADKNFLKKNIFLLSLSSTILFISTIIIAFLVGIFKIDLLVNFFGTSVWNPFGSVNALALFAAVGFVFAVGALFSDNSLRRGFKSLLVLEAISSLIVILIIGYKNAYLAIAFAILVFIGLIFARFRKNFIKRINIPLLIFAVFLMLFIFSVSFSRFFIVPVEISPNINLSFEVAGKSMTEGVKNFVLGSGPSTFAYDFARYKPDLLNQTGLWNVRFTSGFAAIPTLMTELGLLGLLSLGVFIIFNLFFLFKKVMMEKNRDDYFLVGLFLSFLILVVSLFIYPLSFVTFFYLVLIMIMARAIAGIAKEEVEVFSFDTLPHKALIGALSLIGVLIGSAFILFIFSSHFRAEINYTKGLQALSRGEVNVAMTNFSEAISWYHDDAYYRTLGVTIVSDSINKINLGIVNQDEIADVQNNFQNGINFAKEATKINPLERENWFALGAIYENLIPFVGNAGDASIQAYSEIEKLEPMNPIVYLSKGRAYLAYAKFLNQNIASAKGQQDVDEEKIKQAEEKVAQLLENSLTELNVAVGRKMDLEAIYLVLAQLYETKGDIDVAIENLQKARIINGQNIDSLFNLGRLLYNKGEYEQAITGMENILEVMPAHINAKFILGLSYDAQGESDKALDIFKELSEAQPENKEVEQILDNIKKGLPAIERSTSVAQPESADSADKEEESEEPEIEEIEEE